MEYPHWLMITERPGVLDLSLGVSPKRECWRPIVADGSEGKFGR